MTLFRPTNLVKKALQINSERLRNVLFLHIAKCGGISVDRALRWKYLNAYQRLDSEASLRAALSISDLDHPFDDYYHSVHKFRDKILLYEFLKRTKFISGHFAYASDAHEIAGQGYVLMTVLREPVDRYLSAFFFNQAKADESPWKINDTLDEFLSTNPGRYYGMDYARILSGTKHHHETIDVQIEQSKSHLRKFGIVGILEKPKALESQIHEKLGIRVRIGCENVTAQRKPVAKIDPALRERIAEICRPNMEIYEHALRSPR